VVGNVSYQKTRQGKLASQIPGTPSPWVFRNQDDHVLLENGISLYNDWCYFNVGWNNASARNFWGFAVGAHSESVPV